MTEKSTPKKVALIYARVSTKKQDSRSQVVRCEQYCKQKGYLIEKIFEDNYTGGGDFRNRPAMQELLTYVKNKMHQEYVVVFDDIKRFARDVQFHISLRTTFSAYGLTPECLNYNFDETPEGKFMEVIHAAQAELERHQNRRQVIQKQKARMIAGYNAFNAPKGYNKVKDKLHGTLDVQNEQASILKKALKKFAYGELVSRMEVAHYLKKHHILGKQEAFRYLYTVFKILNNPFYAGYIHYKPWDIDMVEGHHEPLITLKEFRLIQNRLNATAHAKPIRQDINPEFPLRSLIDCYHCKRPLTGCKSKGNGGIYYKYYCKNKKCSLRQLKSGIKSVPRDKLHEEFKSLVCQHTPSKEVWRVAHESFKSSWNEGIKNRKQRLQRNQKEKQQIEVEIENLLKLVSAPNISEALRKRYEAQIEKCDAKIQEIEGRQEISKEFEDSCRTSFENLLGIAKNPYEIWVSSDVKQKQQLFYYLFEGNLEYCPKEGFRTIKKAISIRLFEEFSTSDSLGVKTQRNRSNLLLELVNNQNMYLDATFS